MWLKISRYNLHKLHNSLNLITDSCLDHSLSLVGCWTKLIATWLLVIHLYIHTSRLSSPCSPTGIWFCSNTLAHLSVAVQGDIYIKRLSSHKFRQWKMFKVSTVIFPIMTKIAQNTYSYCNGWEADDACLVAQNMTENFIKQKAICASIYIHPQKNLFLEINWGMVF